MAYQATYTLSDYSSLFAQLVINFLKGLTGINSPEIIFILVLGLLSAIAGLLLFLQK